MKRLVPAALALAAFGFAGFQAPPQRPSTNPPPSKQPAGKPRPKAAPKPPPVLEGTVKGPDGKPIEGARVFYTEVATLGFSPALAVRTDAEGRFRTSLKSGRPLQVQVEAKGLAARTFDKVQPGAPLLVTLERGRTIEGRVRDGAGQPVPGARLVARAQSSIVPSLWEVEANRLEATADARGRYRLEGVGPGFYAVTARAPGGAAQKHHVRPGSTVDLVLQPKASLSGTVLDLDRRPVPGALVRAELEPYGSSSDIGKTDAHGRFELLGLDAGTYTVVARHADFAPAAVSGLLVEAVGHAEVTLVVTPGVAVTGRVLGPEERPVMGRVVVQEMSGQPAPRCFGELLRTEAAADGHFRIERVPAGAFVLGVVAQGFAGRRVEVEVTGRESVVDVGDVLLDLGLAIRGRVRTREGAPVANAALRAYQDDATRGGTPGETRSEADGSFVLAGLSPGPYMVNVSAPGFAGVHREVPAGSDSVDFVLDRGGAITGIVVEEGDRPVDAYRVVASPVKPEPRFEGGAQKEVGSPDGRFLLEDLVEGDYVLQVHAPDRSAATVRATVVAQRTTDVGSIRVGRGGIVRGSVVDATGGPVVGATVRIHGPGQDAMLWMQTMTAESDPSGAFEIRGVPEGPKQVVGSHPDYGPADAQVDVVLARSPAEARLVLGQGGRIEGSVRKRDGTPLAGLRVTAWSRSGGRYWGGQPHTTTGADGRFALSHVRPGPINVNLMSSGSPGRPISMTMQSRTVEVREGETTTVDFISREILVTGRVTRSGTPLPGLEIQLMGEGMGYTTSALDIGVAAAPTGPQRLRGVTDEDGSFSLIVDDPGKYHVRIESQDGRRQYGWSRRLEIPDVETHHVEIAFTGMPVTGVVVDKETEQPVEQAWVSLFPKARKGSAGPSSSGPSSATTGADGRFQLEADPGDNRLLARADDYVQAQSDVTIAAAGTSDLRLELERGLEIRGRVVDPNGRAVSGISVHARGDERVSGWARTLADGSFRLGGLAPQAYNLCAGAELAGYAVQVGVRPGDSDVRLTVRPAGTVRLLVRGPDGAPLPKAYASVSKVDGAPVNVPYTGGPGTTDSSGFIQVPSPAGSIELQVSALKYRGSTTQVSVGEGATVGVEVTLKEPVRKP